MNIGKNEIIVGNRDKWIIDTLQKIPAGSKILDVGAGQCPFKKNCSHLNYMSQDFSQYDGFWDDQIKEGSADSNRIDIVCDIVSIPVESGSFDAVMCTEVLEHVPDPIAALSEISRVLRPGGYLLLTAPFASYSHFEPFHFAAGFNRFFYEHHLPKLGYTILDLKANGNFYEYLGLKIRWLSDISSKHSNSTLDVMDKLSIRGILRTLQKLSDNDKGSDTFLNNGLFVFAQKNN
jgi:ubiquinone/menaquinone biosynthesis C-methylase UbiE